MIVQASADRLGTSAQTLNVFGQNDLSVMAGGIAVLMLAAGIQTVRQPVLPRWLGWTAIVIGVMSLDIPAGFLGFFFGLIWILVVAIVLVVRSDLVAAGAVQITEASS